MLITSEGVTRLPFAAWRVLLLVSLVACDRVSNPADALAVESSATVPQQLTNEWPKTNFSKRTIDLSEVQSGGPPKDGIPAIDEPRFVSASAAQIWLNDDEPVIAVRLGSEARAYPLQILIFHEIVNDVVDGVPIAVTFCPLCNASMVFQRRLNGTTLDFGTTGRLRNSDLIMYDRQSESWWQQFTGESIVGRYAGSVLSEMQSQITSFGDFREAYPTGRVLSRSTGHGRPYGRNPYRGYDRIGQTPFMLDEPADPRLPAMERVLGVSINGRSRVHPFSDLLPHPVINSEFEQVPYVVFSKAGLRSALDAEAIAESRTVPAAAAFRRTSKGIVYEFDLRENRIVDLQTGSEWSLFGTAVAGPRRGDQLEALPGGVHFAFAWLAFKPDSEIFRAQ